MTLRVVTDSTCDLPAETIARLGIHVLPMYINIGKKGYLDGIDISREEFYNRLPEFPELPTTAVPSVERFRAAYNSVVDEGANEVLAIHVSSTLSAAVNVARLAAREITSAIVTVFDSRQLSLGLGFMAETAARMAQAGSTTAEVFSALNSQIRRSHVFALLDTLEYVKRSGRVNKYLASFATMLQIKPIMTLYDGKPGTQRVRTNDGAMKRLVEMLEALGALERVAIVHTHALPERLEELRRLAGRLLPEGPILTVDVTPVIGVHLGPGALGFAAVRASE